MENLTPTGIRSPDRPARSQSLYRLSYPAHVVITNSKKLKLQNFGGLLCVNIHNKLRGNLAKYVLSKLKQADTLKPDDTLIDLQFSLRTDIILKVKTHKTGI